MNWSKAAAYGMLAVYDIAKRQRGVPATVGVQAREVARRYKLPVAYASKVMGQLARAGVLQSDRGPRGGFRLNRPIDKITLCDVLEAVEEFGNGARKPAPGYPAAVQAMLARAFKEGDAQLREIYRRYSAAELI